MAEGIIRQPGKQAGSVVPGTNSPLLRGKIQPKHMLYSTFLLLSTHTHTYIKHTTYN